MCKSHVMIMIHSEWCLLFFTCLLWDGPAIYFWGVGGGVSKRKSKSCTRKEGEKIGTQGSMGKPLCKSHLFLGFVPGVGHLTYLVLPGEGIFESFFARRGDI